MNQEIYLKVIVLGAVLVVALLAPMLSALSVTAIVGWYIRDKKIGEIPAVKSLLEVAPQNIKGFFGIK